MIDATLRLRRGINDHSLSIVRRILKSNPHLLQNPDISVLGEANTNLHLACRLNDIPIVQLLLDMKHEESGISVNNKHETPLMIAASMGHVEIVNILVALGESVSGVGRRDIRGRDAVMMAAEKGHDTCIQLLLTYAPPLPPGYELSYGGSTTYSDGRPTTASSATDSRHYMNPARALLLNQDYEGNTALHYACAYGQLMVQRTLLAAGADPDRRNGFCWAPVMFSATVAAERYFINLVKENENDYRAARESRARFAEMHAEKETGDMEPQRTPQQQSGGFGLGMPDLMSPPPPQKSMSPPPPVPPIPPMSRAREAALAKVPITQSMGNKGLRLVQDG